MSMLHNDASLRSLKAHKEERNMNALSRRIIDERDECCYCEDKRERMVVVEKKRRRVSF